MTNVKVYNLAGKEVGAVELNPEIFAVPVNMDLITQVLHVQRTNSRQPLAHTITRSFIRGGGKKPWKQKGTGRARAGSSRSPLWRGGAIIFGPQKDRNYSLSINKKQKTKALLMALSEKAKNEQLVVIDDMSLKTPKTKEMVSAMKALKISGRPVLMAMAKKSDEVKRSAANIQRLVVISADSLNLEDILKAKYLVIDQASLPVIEKTFKK